MEACGCGALCEQGGGRRGTERASLKFDIESLRVYGALALFASGIALEVAGALKGGPFAWAIYGAAFIAAGAPVLSGAGRALLRCKPLDELSLMSVAGIGAIALGELAEAAAVMAFYALGEHLQEKAVAKANASIRGLASLKEDSARVLGANGEERVEPASGVRPGDRFALRPGERCPVDGRVLRGRSLADTRALTGEGLPRELGPGDEMGAGMIALDGAIELAALRPQSESAAARIMRAMDEARERKSRTERFVTRFARIYTPIVFAMALAIALAPPLLAHGQDFGVWLERALVLLVISCPCALVISIPLGYRGGIGAASRMGILVKGSEALDALAGVKAVAFDKTGTITEGSFAVKGSAFHGPEDAALLARRAGDAAVHSNHPVSRAIADHARALGLPRQPAPALSVRESAGRGIHVIDAEGSVRGGSDRFLHDEGIPHPVEACAAGASEGFQAFHVALDDRYVGVIYADDAMRPGAAEAVAGLKGLGVARVAMLSGDTAQRAARFAADAGIGEAHGGLSPEGKLAALERLMAESPGKVAAVGDGINDAPILARADVGIAFGSGAQDAAIESADVVVLGGDLSLVPRAIALARRTLGIVRQNMAAAFAAKLAFLALGAIGLAGMWEAVFADTGVALIAVLNARRAGRE
jgi:Cd2+/Zn2+-exporting ATPase